jgi:hypothetical protein
VWALFYQTIGGAVIIPLWYLFFTFSTATSKYWSNASEMSSQRSRTLLPALLVGYLLPTMLMYAPNIDIMTRQFFVAFWQPSPIFVNIIWVSLSAILLGKERRGPSDSISYIKATYAASTAISALVHIGVIAACLTSNNPDLSIAKVLLPGTRDHNSMSKAMHFIFKADYWIIVGAALTSCVVAAWDLKYLRTSKAGFIRPVALLIAAAVAVGPGAAYSAFWYFREKQMHKVKPKVN